MILLFIFFIICICAMAYIAEAMRNPSQTLLQRIATSVKARQRSFAGLHQPQHTPAEAMTGLLHHHRARLPISGLAQRILVVDDDTNVLVAASGILRKGGFEPVTASSGAEALRHLERETYNLILLDLRMPEISGYDVLKQLKADPAVASTPVILITGAEPREIVGLDRLQVAAVLHKPADPAELVAAVKQFATASPAE